MNCFEKAIGTKAEIKRYVNSVKSKNVKRTKKKEDENVKFFNSSVTPSMIINLFTDKNGRDQKKREKILSDGIDEENKTILSIIKNEKSIVPSYWKKIRGLSKLKTSDMTIFQKAADGENITSLSTIQRGVAFHHIVGSIKTEFDLMEKYNLSENERNMIMPEGEIVPGISANGLLAAIGKDILASQGIVLQPKNSARRGDKKSQYRAQFEVEMVYSNVGMKAAKQLQQDGFIDIEMPGENSGSPMVINHDYKKNNGESLSKSKVIEGIVLRINMDKMLNRNDDSPKITESDSKLLRSFFNKKTSAYENRLVDSKWKSLVANTQGATFLNRLIVPSSSLAPATEYKKNNHSDHDIKVSEATKKNLDRKEQGELFIPDELSAMFDYIYDMMEREGLSFEDAARSLGINEYKDMMGYIDESDSTSATRSSNMGKSLSKTTPLSEFFDNYMTIRNMPMHLREEMKRNGRGHYMTTFMNPQTDKFFSRYVMQIKPYTVQAFNSKGEMTETFDHILAGISDQSGIPVDDILNSKEGSKLDDLLASYDAIDKSSGQEMFMFMAQAFKVHNAGLSGSVWQQLDSLKAIYSVREMIANNKAGGSVDFTGTFMPKPDGTASGAVIMALQMAGKNEKNASLFEYLELNKAGKAKNDAYGVVQNALEEKNKLEGKVGLKTEMTNTLEWLSTNVFNSMRDLAKFSSMTVMYNQGRQSSVSNVAKDLFDPTYRKLESSGRGTNSKERIEVANKIKEWIKISNEFLYEQIKDKEGVDLVKTLTSDKYSDSVYSSGIKYMEENVTNTIYELTQQSFVREYLSEHQDITNGIFSEMKSLYDKKEQRISLIPPEAVFNAVLKKNGGKFDINNFEHLTDDEMIELRKNGKGKESENGIPLMKLFESVSHPKDNATVSRWEFPHAINAMVNIVHAIDFAILNESFRRTYEEMDDQNLKNELQAIKDNNVGTVSIHDAIAAHPSFSLAFQNHYREAARDINAVYDIHSAMAFELSRMKGYVAKESAPATKGIAERYDKKLETLKGMDSGGKKVFGFESVGDVDIPFGQELVTVKQKKSAKAQNKKLKTEQEKTKGLTRFLTVSDGKRSYNEVSNIINSGKPYVIYDTETTGMDNKFENELDIGKGAVPSMPYQVAGEVIDENGESTPFNVFFKTKKLSKSVQSFLDKQESESGKTIDLDYINKEASKDGRTNKQKLEYLEKILGGKPMIAYNANFDSAVMTELLGETFNDSLIDTTSYDALGAIAYEDHVKNGTVRSDGMPLSKKYTEVTKKDALDAHQADGDVKMTKALLDNMDTKIKTTVPSPKNNKVGDNKRTENIADLVKSFNSPMINDFLKREGDSKIKWGNNSEYIVSDHTISILNHSKDSKKRIQRALEHEILHYDTVGFMYANPNDVDVKKVGLTVDYLKKNKLALKSKLKDPRSLSMLDYVTKQGNDFRNAAEFVAVLGSEPEVMADFEQASRSKGVIKFIAGLLDKIRNYSQSNTEISPFSAEDVGKAIADIQKKGIEFNKDAKKADQTRTDIDKDSSVGKSSYQSPDNGRKAKTRLEEALDYNKQADTGYVTNDPIAKFISESNSFVADLLYARLGDNATGLAEKGAKYVDEFLSRKSKVYRDYKESVMEIWDSPGMQATKAWLVPSSVKDRATLHKMARVFQEASQIHGKITSTEVTKLENMMSGMSVEEQEKLNDMFALTPAFMLVKHGGLLFNLADGSTNIQKEIDRIESGANKVDIKDAKDFANLYVDGIATGDKYNMYQKGFTAKRQADIDELTGLYSLRKIDGAEKLLYDIGQNRPELLEALVEKSRALEQVTLDIYNETGDKKRFKGNMVLEYYKEPFDIQVVPKEDLSNGKFNMNDGWEVIIPAEDNHGHAVLIRKGAENAYQESFGTNVDYGKTDVYMPEGFVPKNGTKGLVEFGEGKNKRYKVAIPTKIKKDIGLIQNPAQTILRSYAHIEKIQRTQAIRDEILSNSGLRYKIYSNKDRDTRELAKMAKERAEGEPWFVDMDSDVDYSKLPEEIRKRYSPIKTHMSGIGSFSSKVRLVRNDIAPWMAGYERAMPFKDTPGLRQLTKVLTQAIALMKIHMIIVNPAKVALDAISTHTLLVSNGVSPITIARGWKKNLKLMSEMSRLKSKEADYAIRARGGNKSAERMLKKVQASIRNHPLQGAMNAGVMQSLTTDIITRDSDTISGLQNSIDKIFNRLTKTKDGNPNGVHKAIVAFSKFGINIEDLMEKVANMGEGTQFEQFTNEIGIMGDRIGKIKKDEDVAKYLSEYFASPSSTLTRIGSVATTYPDAMARIIYRDHLISKTGKTESQLTDKEISDINLQVSDMMPDYLFAPPMELDALGRFFITPFVSYSARIQRVILNLANKNPLTFFGGILMAESMGLEPGSTPYHVVGSNYLTREEFINNVFTDLFDLQTPLPVNTFNFDVIK